ncbi:MAG: NAD-dependent epimerase/dehydratase [Anaerolineae bacterium]
MDEHFLVTGAQGCIGAWILKNLISERVPVTVIDLDTRPRRLGQIVPEAEIARVDFVQGDVSDAASLAHLVAERGITHIIHLAGLQTPACQADPITGARVNVIGTLAVFEAARRYPSQVQRIVYASSIGVFGQLEAYQGAVRDDSPPTPVSHYGVFKLTNEGNARIYWREHHISSIGLRPLTVYGPGRDQGMTSAPTRAMKAAVVGRPFTIPFSGKTDMLYVDDCARMFIRCARVPFQGAEVYNLSGELASISDIVACIEAVLPEARNLIRVTGDPMPFYPLVDDSRLRALTGVHQRTSLRAGVEQTIRHFQALQRAGRLDTSELEQNV